MTGIFSDRQQQAVQKLFEIKTGIDAGFIFLINYGHIGIVLWYNLYSS